MRSLLCHFGQRKRLSPCDRWILAILNNLGNARRKHYKPVVPENYLPKVT
ncbi:hypothetical protein [Phormidium nigroviride]